MSRPEITLDQWRPRIPGWSDDILPFYQDVAEQLAPSATFVEVGVHSGRSLFFLAAELVRLGKTGVDLVAVDWWKGKDFREQLLHTIVGNRFNEVTAEEIDMVRIVSSEGARAARLFDDGAVDGIFIDSDHEKAGMIAHLLAWRPKVRWGGFIAGHDYSVKDWPGVVEAVDGFFGAGAVEHPTRSVWCVRLPEHP